MKEASYENNRKADLFAELEQSVHSALETYSNVHRGSGHNSLVTTHLFEQARHIVLEYLGSRNNREVVIFCTPRRAELLKRQLNPASYKIVSSREIGLSLGVTAVAVKRKALPARAPFHTGGGTARLISRKWIIWATAPDRFEAGTPAIINVITFAKALRLIRKYGNDIFLNSTAKEMTVSELLYHDFLEAYSGKDLLFELKQTLIGREMSVPTIEGVKTFINLDNSASTPTFMPIWDSFRRTLGQTDRVKQDVIHEVRSICAEQLGAPQANYDMIFTSNTTEAINLAAESLSRDSADGLEPVVLSTLLEHSSNDLPWRMVPRCSLIRLKVDDEGFIDLNELETIMRSYNKEKVYEEKRIRLVALSGASNVLGVCNNIMEISKTVHKYGAELLVDAAQLIAHRDVDMEAFEIDYLAFSAHKVYAPFGCGALVVRKGLLNFSSDELNLIRSSGEENTGGIAALGKAFMLLQRIGMEVIQTEEQALTARALTGLMEIPGLRIFGIDDPDSPSFDRKLGVIVFDLKGIMADRVAKALAEHSGIGVRYGCHCAHIIVKHILNVSPGLERFQRLMLTLLPQVQLPGLTRISLGIENSEEDVERMILAVARIAQQSRDHSFSKVHKKNNQSKTGLQQQMKDLVTDSARRVYS